MLRKHSVKNIIVIIIALLMFDILPVKAQSFFPDLPYRVDIPSPENIFGFRAGDKPVNHADALDYLNILADKSPLVQVFKSGKTHEGRDLVYLLISSEENIQNLETIREHISLLGDPRKKTSGKSRDQIVATSPAIAWMMYGIHGDELSGGDAAIQLAYHLAAATDAATTNLLKNLVIGIDPFENPDGRERYLAQMQQWSGTIPSSDAQSIQHTSVWPWGRTNHYYFDLNRDWIIVSQPETRARVNAINHWNPQLVVDAHEMGSYSTFLFNPPREPINPHINTAIRKWWDKFAADQAQAFNKNGWSYYTKEWLEDWYPGYGSAWPCYRGAVGILYEQASYDGSLVKKPGGIISTYRDAVHRQLTSSIANLTTLAENRQQLLGDFRQIRRIATQRTENRAANVYIFEPGENPSRLNHFLERLIAQGIEVERLEKDIQINQVKNFRSGKTENHRFRSGAYVVRARQPYQPLIHAMLEPDPRMITSFLKTERESLEKGKGTKLYEVSGWSLVYAYDLNAYSSVRMPSMQTAPITGLSKPELKPLESEPDFGYLIPYTDDSVVDALISLLQKQYNVRVARKPFTIANRSYDRGTLLIRLNENPPQILDDLNEIIATTLIDVVSINTALSQQGPNLGGGEFRLLVAPKTALLTGPQISSYNFGALWYLLDYELKLHVSVLNHNRLSRLDLRKYNILILPSGGRGATSYKQIFQKEELNKLKNWIENGGTLIAVGSACTFLADSATGLSQVKLRRQVLTKIDEYMRALDKEDATQNIKVDSLMVWEGNVKSPKKIPGPSTDKMNMNLKEEEDAYQRIFMPRGAIMRVILDPEHWLNFGLGTEVPALYYSSYAYLAKKPVQSAGRFSDSQTIRFSGLLWPEARERWARSAFITREAKGSGQIILITNEPNFRSYFYGTARLLINAILLGPGMGAQQVVPF
jgi:hypothetical protein